MKLIFENWRKYLLKEESDQDLMARWQQALRNAGVPDPASAEISKEGPIEEADDDDDDVPPEAKPPRELPQRPYIDPESEQEELVPRMLPVLDVTPGSLPPPEESGFCIYNPKINEYAQANADQFAETLMFVLSTIQKSWPTVIPYFQDLMNYRKLGFDFGTPFRVSDPFKKSPRKKRKARERYKIEYQGYASPKAKKIGENLLKSDLYSGLHQEEIAKIANNISSMTGTPDVQAYNTIWDNRGPLFARIQSSLEEWNRNRNPFELYKIFLQFKGLGPAKAGFATQMVIGQLGCIDSINQQIYYGDNIPTLLKRSFKNASPEKLAEAANGYKELLDDLSLTAGGSKEIWDAWTRIVAFQINNPRVPYFVKSVRVDPETKEKETIYIPRFGGYSKKEVGTYKGFRDEMEKLIIGMDVGAEHWTMGDPKRKAE